jgi:ArsR family transcriptional regulator, arsenate/arsenite/antimonite-responsive transcriptional repressor
MEMEDAIKRLSALAQEGRLEVFRLLVKAGPEGKAAGEIARALGIQANTLSAQLLVLSNARLLRARREGRSIIYSVNFESISGLLVFLMEDCCGGRSEVCLPLAEVARRCRAPSKGVRREAVSRSSARR